MATPLDSILSQPAHGEPHEIGEHKTSFRVSREQAEAYRALPKDLQDKLGPPVYGQVLKAEELRSLALMTNGHAEVPRSTIMCPW